ncbi:hypothetical protein JI666_14010 [Bacillus sp. NTK071]|uniref:hypothetical protein n=1 Tax=Bacillus sp. NTK071 TaxID=2802175 RepID=UPI001A8E1F87|nr:hypothetical protein [Bacillus sp. NTK071]MBN8209867.1 hypothetical protein [Bacillus sp. NTK071]
MRGKMLILCLFIVSGCSMPSFVSNQFIDPEKLMKEAQENMMEIESMKTEGKINFEGNLAGIPYTYNATNDSQAKMDEGIIIEAYMTIAAEGTGIQPSTEQIYFSTSEYGIYDQSTDSWDLTGYLPEEQLLIDLFSTSLNPSNSMNQYFESKIDTKLDVIGQETIDGVDCVGIYVETNADQMMSEISPLFSFFAGPAGKLSTSLTGALVKNLEITYWIGKQDKLVYKLETKLPTPIFDYTSTLRIYEHNSEFVSLKDR